SLDSWTLPESPVTGVVSSVQPILTGLATVVEPGPRPETRGVNVSVTFAPRRSQVKVPMKEKPGATRRSLENTTFWLVTDVFTHSLGFTDRPTWTLTNAPTRSGSTEIVTGPWSVSITMFVSVVGKQMRPTYQTTAVLFMVVFRMVCTTRPVRVT